MGINVVVKKEYSTAYKLFHFGYYAYVPQSYRYDEAYREIFGTPSTGNREMDHYLAKTPVLSYISVADMALLFDKGAEIIIEDPKKTVEIYTLIKTHLLEWEERLYGYITEEEVPHEELRILEAFGSEVFKKARYYLNDEVKQQSITQKINQLQQSPFSREDRITLKENKVLPQEPRNISESIVKELFRRQKKWRK